MIFELSVIKIFKKNRLPLQWKIDKFFKNQVLAHILICYNLGVDPKVIDQGLVLAREYPTLLFGVVFSSIESLG